MRALSTSRLLIVCCLSLASSASAQETVPASTTVKVYRVGDLVAQQAVRETTVLKPVTPKEWGGEHPQTLESLNNLAKLIETIVPAEVGAVAAYADSLSLVVRHSPAGHEQVVALLEQLREQERPVVELTLIPLVGLEDSNRSFSDEQSSRLEEILAKQNLLNPDETQEITKLLETNKEASNFLAKPISVRLVNGRKTPLPWWMSPIYTTAVLTKDSNVIHFRFDNLIDGDNPSNVVAQAQSFSVPAGHSVLFATNLGMGMYWLAVPKKIEPEQKVTAVSPASDP